MLCSVVNTSKASVSNESSLITSWTKGEESGSTLISWTLLPLLILQYLLFKDLEPCCPCWSYNIEYSRILNPAALVDPTIFIIQGSWTLLLLLILQYLIFKDLEPCCPCWSYNIYYSRILNLTALVDPTIFIIQGKSNYSYYS